MNKYVLKFTTGIKFLAVISLKIEVENTNFIFFHLPFSKIYSPEPKKLTLSVMLIACILQDSGTPIVLFNDVFTHR
jgi:hypothetical protein